MTDKKPAGNAATEGTRHRWLGNHECHFSLSAFRGAGKEDKQQVGTKTKIKGLSGARFDFLTRFAKPCKVNPTAEQLAACKTTHHHTF